MIDKERIKKEAEKFFEWPTPNKDHVTTVSMLIFANCIREMAVAEEREACASICANSAYDVVKDIAEKIRERSDA